ncbi:RWD domain-containing protein 2A [Hyla sarda]|uniref:RWD domain-containing protein 2A n=1 Tax=Hyla sarda TaxID=327740 RepID=UPI0024C21490|nr:RWD domain-containing protein 2A [Hyla sarda]XP_056421947.1 RWD domain-containing protein 2A [Hyla sarda]
MSTSVRECLELQLLEMDMLFSMFPRKEDIVVKGVNSLSILQRYLEGTYESLPPSIEFNVFIKTDDLKEKTELHVYLPHSYPTKEPQLFVRSGALDKLQHNDLNKCLTTYINSLERGDLCITNAIQWLTDNISSYVEKSKLNNGNEADVKKVSITFHRMWIYSHHIYRQELRKKILDCAKQLHLTGFCLTGKPGVICIEGDKERCEEFWRDIRYPNWKHISCKHTESQEVTDSMDSLRLFQSFEELTFEAHGDYGLRNDYHMDLGQFFEYLRRHQSEHIFQILFGIEGKSSSDSFAE